MSNESSVCELSCSMLYLCVICSIFFGTWGNVGCFKLITDFVIRIWLTAHGQHSCPLTFRSFKGITLITLWTDNKLKGHWIQNGTWHAQLVISPVWEMLAVSWRWKDKTLDGLSQPSPFLKYLHLKTLIIHDTYIVPPLTLLIDRCLTVGKSAVRANACISSPHSPLFSTDLYGVWERINSFLSPLTESATIKGKGQKQYVRIASLLKNKHQETQQNWPKPLTHLENPTVPTNIHNVHF